MSLLEKTILLRGAKGELKVQALFDSGASFSCIRTVFAEQISHLEPLSEPMEFETADEGEIIRAEYAIRADFFFEDTPRRFSDELIVIDTLAEDLIIGATTMQKWKIRLDFDAEEIIYDKKMHRLRI